jgi:hypothetical protein
MRAVTSIYQNEARLVSDFAAAYSITNQNISFIPIKEVKTSLGIADLVIVLYDNKAVRERMKALSCTATVPPFSRIAAYAMSFLSQVQQTTATELRDFLKIDSHQFSNLLNTLQERKLITAYRNGPIKIRNVNKLFVIYEIETFEAKLRDWRRAIRQAERHLWFTNNSYVVLPLLPEDSFNRATRVCQKTGIGLIIQEAENSYKTIQEPRDKGFYNTHIVWALNESIIDQLSSCS